MFAEATFISTIFALSAATNVYDAVCALVASSERTTFPVPISSVIIEAKLEDEGVAKKVATPVPNPDTPVDTGSPVAFVNVPEVGVPNAPPLITGAPAVPVLTASAVAIPVPRPEIPVDTGSPVAFVRTPDAGVPSAGVVSIGLVKVLLVSVSVFDAVDLASNCV